MFNYLFLPVVLDSRIRSNLRNLFVFLTTNHEFTNSNLIGYTSSTELKTWEIFKYTCIKEPSL